MKPLFLLITLLFFSCDEPKYTMITVKNQTASLMLEEIMWNDIDLATSLSPNGKTWRNFNNENDTIFGKPRSLRMKMRGPNGVATVETLQKWPLIKDKSLTIIVSDTTSLIKP